MVVEVVVPTIQVTQDVLVKVEVLVVAVVVVQVVKMVVNLRVVTIYAMQQVEASLQEAPTVMVLVMIYKLLACWI